MKKQKVVRTWSDRYSQKIEDLAELLDDGYIVVCVTPIDRYLEYIVEKEVD